MKKPLFNAVKAPLTPEKKAVFTTHGQKRVDEFSYLKEQQNPKVVKLLANENEYTEKSLADSAPLRTKLYKEIRSRITEDDMSVPVIDGPYSYYTRTKKGKQYAIHCRKRVSENGHAKEEIFLDENALAKHSKFFALGDAEVSPDHTKLAYSTDTSGNEKFTLYIKDLSTGKLLSDTVTSVSSIVWCEDGEHIYYTKENHPHPPRQVFIHRIGTDASKDRLIFEEENDRWYVSIHKSRSKKYLFISISNFDASEVRYLSAHDANDTPTLIAARRKKIKYSLEHHGDSFYLITNEKAVNFKVMHSKIPRVKGKNKIKKFKWKTWLPYKKERALQDIAAYRDFILVEAREKGNPVLYIADPKTAKLSPVVLPEKECSISLWDMPNFDTSLVRFTFTSFLTPRTVFEYDVVEKKLIVKKRQETKQWDPRLYHSETLWAKNGSVKIPISICYKKSTKLASAPVLLNAYGSYGITQDAAFSVARQTLLDRGWIIAIAHPRGGGELGWSWHEASKLLTKHRTYQDFIACADHLLKLKYGTREKMVITGGSAGGMTMGAVLNIRPDLCGGALVYVPNADTVTSMLDTSLGGTILHYDEIGDPRKKEVYQYLMKWSPYENVKHEHYPQILVRASLKDIRTPSWEAHKWVARLRSRASGGPILFKVEMHAGHGGKSGRYEWIKETAHDYAFIISRFGRVKNG